MARILLCEDDPVCRELARAAMSEDGHDIACVENGTAALDQLRHAPYDLLVTDIVLPDKDGLEVIRELRAVGGRIKILAMTAGLPDLRDHFLSAARVYGADDVIAKPFRGRELRATVARMLAPVAG